MIEEGGWRSRLRNLGVAVKLFRNWPAFIMAYAQKPREPAVFKLRNGLRLTLRPGTSDFRIVREIMVWREYVRPGFELASTNTVVDIGAQIGIFSSYAAKAVPRGRVLSFEPHPDNYRLLEQNRQLNSFANMMTFNRAVAETAGKHEFFASAFNTGGHSLYEQPGAAVRFEVETVRLEDVLKQQGIVAIDYLKIDCEGAEVEILRSLSVDLLHRVERIVMEVHTEIDATEAGLAGWLKQFGFKVNVEGSMVYARRECKAKKG